MSWLKRTRAEWGVELVIIWAALGVTGWAIVLYLLWVCTGTCL